MTLMAQLELQMSVEAGHWPPDDVLEGLVDRTLNQAASFLAAREGQPFPLHPVEVSLVFTDDATIEKLNAQWRGQAKPTNVLSFPAYPIKPGDRPGPMLGDIILAQETLTREALDLSKPLEDHLTHLIVHGFLHLLGYDHLDDEEASIMEGLESSIMASLGLSDPYGHNDPI